MRSGADAVVALVKFQAVSAAMPGNGLPEVSVIAPASIQTA